MKKDRQQYDLALLTEHKFLNLQLGQGQPVPRIKIDPTLASRFALEL